jgi:RNA-binding protein 25
MHRPAPALFQVEDEVEVKPVRAFVKIDFAEEERVAAALAQQKAAETAAKINARGDDVKALIDSIPTDKTALFAYPIHWAAVEKHHVVKEKMAPWVTKKVVEYLGEEDATLISFILTKLAAKAKPEQVLDELQAILEDEAEVFVKSLWRKLAFEALRAAA